MSIAVRQLRQFIVFFVILNLVISPLLAFGSKAEKAYELPFPVKNSFNTLIPIPPHAEHSLLIKFRDEASTAQRLQIVESYGVTARMSITPTSLPVRWLPSEPV